MDSTVRSRPNHYEVLGLAPTATSNEIAQAFARELGLLQPRPFGSLAEVTVAYATLRDPSKRSAYDASLRPEPEPKPVDPPVRRHESAAFLGMALVDRLERPAVNPAPPPPPPVEPTPGPEPRAKPPFLAASTSSPVKPGPEEPRRPEAAAKPGIEPLAGGNGALHFAEAERLHFSEDAPINRKLPALAGGLLVLAVGFGVWTGLEAGNGAGQGSLEQTATLKVPPVDALPITTNSPPAPAPTYAEARPERRARAANVAKVAPARTPLQIDLADAPSTGAAQIEPAQPQSTATEQTSEEFPYVHVKPRTMPLPNPVIARTIGRIGYPCGQVASTTAGGAPGVFKVTCTSGHSYRAAPVRGRYHFRRLGKS